MDLEDIRDIWTPSIYIQNAIDIKDQRSFGDMSDSLINMWYKSDEQMVLFVEKFVVEFSCSMKFQAFPFDHHACHLDLVNWLGGSARVQLQSPVLYVWDNGSQKEISGPVVNKASNKLDYSFKFESKPSQIFIENGIKYSMTQIQVSLNRTAEGQAKVFSSFQVPIGVFAILSLVSYVIELEQVAGRMGLLITLSLIMINTYNSVDAPSKRGFSTIELWFGANLFPIFVGIFEYGILLTIKKFSDKNWTLFGKSFSIHAIAKLIDLATLITTFLYLCIFNVYFWMFTW